MSNLVTPWGSDGRDAANNSPNHGGWDYLPNQFRGSQDNVVAGAAGWTVQQVGGGTEVLVTIGGLVTTITAVSVTDLSGVIHAAAAQVLKMLVRVSPGVAFASTANLANVWIVAISNDANVANVNLVYSASDSVPESGELVFKSAATDFTLATAATTTLTVNSTSSLHGAAVVLPRKPTTGPTALTGTPITANVAVSVVA